MPNRFEWSEIVIVGLVGGVAAACLALAMRLGASVDNLLNFFGGAVGSGLAVVASLWLESHKRARRLEQMMTSLVNTASVAMRFQDIDDKFIVPLIVTFQQSAEAFEACQLGATVEDPLHQYAFQSSIYWLKRGLQEMTQGIEDLNAGEITESQLSLIGRTHAKAIIQPVEDFLRQPGLPKQPLASFQYLKNKIVLAE